MAPENVKRKSRRITGEARERLRETVVNRYRNGASIRTIAADTARSYGATHRLLCEAGVELRSRGGANGNQFRRN